MTNALNASTQTHHGACHRGHQFLFGVFGNGEHIGADHSQRSAAFDDPRARDELFATRRPQQIDFEFDAQDIRSGGHQRVRRVPASCIRDDCHNAGVKVAVVLREIGAVRKLDLNHANFNQREPRANQVHDRLSSEAARDVGGECWIERFHVREQGR